MRNRFILVLVSLLLHGCYAGNVNTQSFYSDKLVMIEVEKLFTGAGYEKCQADLYENAFCSVETGYLSFFVSLTEKSMLIEMYVVHVSSKAKSLNELEAITKYIESKTSYVRSCTKTNTQWGLVSAETDSCEGS